MTFTHDDEEIAMTVQLTKTITWGEGSWGKIALDTLDGFWSPGLELNIADTDITPNAPIVLLPRENRRHPRLELRGGTRPRHIAWGMHGSGPVFGPEDEPSLESFR